MGNCLHSKKLFGTQSWAQRGDFAIESAICKNRKRVKVLVKDYLYQSGTYGKNRVPRELHNPSFESVASVHTVFLYMASLELLRFVETTELWAKTLRAPKVFLSFVVLP